MRRYPNRGVVALEEEGAPTEDEIVEGGQEAETTEAAISEVEASADEPEADAMKDVEEGGQAAEGEEIAEALESIADQLAISAANGGMDKHSAAVVSIATQYMYDRVGIKSKSMPALESFGGASTRIGATQLAMESVKDTIKKIWDAIVSAFKRMVAWVSGHFNKVFGAAERLQKRADAIIKTADDYGTKKMKNSSFENPGLVKALCVGSDIPNNLSEALGHVQDGVKQALGQNANDRLKTAEDVVAAFEDPTGKGKAITVPAVKSSASAEQLKVLGSPGEGYNWLVGSELPGGQAVVIRGPATDKTGLEAMEAFAKLKSGVQAMPGAKIPTKTSVKTLKLADIESIAKVVSTIGAEVESFRATEAKLKELLDKATKAAEAASKKITDDESNKDAKSEGKIVRAAASNMPKYIVGGLSTVSGYALRTGQAALNYCEMSFKQYE